MMASSTGELKDSELTNSPEKQFQDDLKALDVAVSVTEEKVTLCDMILNDLLAVQRIVEEKGLCDAFIQEQKNQADITVISTSL